MAIKEHIPAGEDPVEFARRGGAASARDISAGTGRVMTDAELTAAGVPRVADGTAYEDAEIDPADVPEGVIITDAPHKVKITPAKEGGPRGTATGKPKGGYVGTPKPPIPPGRQGKHMDTRQPNEQELAVAAAQAEIARLSAAIEEMQRPPPVEAEPIDETAAPTPTSGAGRDGQELMAYVRSEALKAAAQVMGDTAQDPMVVMQAAWTFEAYLCGYYPIPAEFLRLNNAEVRRQPSTGGGAHFG